MYYDMTNTLFKLTRAIDDLNESKNFSLIIFLFKRYILIIICFFFVCDNNIFFAGTTLFFVLF